MRDQLDVKLKTPAIEFESDSAEFIFLFLKEEENKEQGDGSIIEICNILP